MGNNLDGIKRAIDFLASQKTVFDKAAEAQGRLWRKEKQAIPPLALCCGLTEEQKSWLSYYSTKDTHYDAAKMFSNGLCDAITVANGGYGGVPSMRANMGCGIIPTLFGLTQTLFDDKMPWLLEHAPKEKLLSMTVADLQEGKEFTAAMQHMAYMHDRLENTGVRVFPLDIQGAFDTAHLVYGDALFYDLYDDPDFIHHLLDLSVKAIIYGMERCLAIIGRDNGVAHYNYLYLPAGMGGIKLSEDTSTLVSAAAIETFVLPNAQRIYAHFNGGYMHYCGKNAHLLDAFFQMPETWGLNLGNPDKHDMPSLIRRLAKAGRIYTGMIDREPGESYYDYFIRLLTPAYVDGVFHILLQLRCAPHEREAVIDAYEKAVAHIDATGDVYAD